MARRGSRDLAVGAMMALALVILALAVMAVGDESRLFVKKAGYRVVFPSADGLVVGSPVKMSGVQVGTVTAIHLSANPERAGIEVDLGVDRTYAGRIREDARAALRILQLLSGEKFVEVIPGTPLSPKLEEGSRIQPHQDPEILKQAAVATENLNDILVSLKKILGALEAGEGLMGQMINDPQFGKEGLEALYGTMANLRTLSSDLIRGRTDEPGFLGRLVYDAEFGAKIDDLGHTIEKLAKLMDSLSVEEGGIGALLEKDGAGQQMIEDLRDAAGSLKNVASRLESREGLIGRLINDPQYSETIARDLKSITGNLAEITDKINRGEGTLGALVNDRTLYEGMEDVVAGANDSKFTRWLLRRYQKKGIKNADAAEEAGGEATGEP